MAGGPSPGLMFPGHWNGMALKKGSSWLGDMAGEGRDFLRSVGTPKTDSRVKAVVSDIATVAVNQE